MTRAAIFLLAFAACGKPPQLAGDAPPPADGAIDAHGDDAEVDASVDGGTPLDPMAAFVALDPTCKSEWCWYWPTPTGNPYYDVSAIAPDNIWILGARGTIFQWNGATWIRHHPPPLPGQDFVELPQQVTGTGKNDMWLILMSAVEHWNGATWTIVEAGPTNVSFYYHRLWIAPDTGDVYLTSNAGLERSHNGGPFSLIYPVTNMVWVWGTSSTDFFYAGPNTILHWDGAGFTQVYGESNKDPYFMPGFHDDAWASGGGATLAHWDGAAWSDVATGLATTTTIKSVAALAPNDVWWMWEGTSSLDQGFLHWNGTSLESTAIDNRSLGDYCCPSIASATIIDGRWWLVTSGGGLFTKIGANAFQRVIATDYVGSDLWGTSDNDMYFSGGGYITHWDGTTRTRIPLPASGSSFGGVAHAGINGANELWSLGYKIDYAPTPYEYAYYGSRYDGQTWTSTELLRSPVFGPRMSSIYPIKAGEALAVGDGGRAFYYHDGAWTPVASGVTTTLYTAWGPDADHVWVAGTHGTLLMWNRANPNVLVPDTTFPTTTDDLGTIHGADGAMWVGHINTTFVSRRTADGWQMFDTQVFVERVFAITDRDVLVASTSNGLISRWNGSAFAAEDFGYYIPMFAVFRPPGMNQHTWLTDGDGVMRHP